MNTGTGIPPAFKPPPQASTKPKQQPPPKKQPYGYSNPFETVREEAKSAVKDVVNTPGELVQDAADQMWGAIFGVEPGPRKKEGEKEPDNFTKLSLEKLNAAHARNDQSAVERLQEELNKHQEIKQESAQLHKGVKQAEEKAIYELEQEEQERQKKIAEEEQQKKQEAEEAKMANQQNSTDGAAKSKAGPGGGRKKAQVEQVFETGQKKG